MYVSFVYFLSKLARNKGTKSRTERGLEFEDVRCTFSLLTLGFLNMGLEVKG